MSAGKRFARLVSFGGLLKLGVLHLLWANGSSWPFRNRKELATSVVGDKHAMPDDEITQAVGTGLMVSAVVAGGVFGNSWFIVMLRRLLGLVLLARGVFGGRAFAQWLGLPKPGKRFEELDSAYYRGVSTLLGIAVLAGAKKDGRSRAAREDLDADGVTRM